MSDPHRTDADAPKYEDVASAPYVYFDRVAAHGVMNGAIQLELASRILVTKPDGGFEVRFATSGRLRCTQAAAMHLRDAAVAALKMLEDTEQKSPAATLKLN